MSSRALISSLAHVSLVAMAVAGSMACHGSPEPRDPPPPEVGVFVVRAEALALTTELPGRTAHYGLAEVRPQVNGIVQKRLFTEGDDVRAGVQLYQIDPATYEAALDSARASLAQSEANLVVARLRADRYRELVAIQAVSEQDYDDAEATRQQAEAGVAADRAAVRRAQIDLDYTRVISPISGRIGRSSVTPGALVTASQAQALAAVRQLDPIYVDMTQSITELLRLRRDLGAGRLQSAGPNQAQVRLRFEDGTEYPLTGRLQFSEVSVDETTGTVTLRAVFPNPKQELLPGMYVRAFVPQAVDEEGLLVPQQGVTHDARGEAVALVVNGESKVEQRVLQAERTVGDRWLVSDGLKPGERVIVEGGQKVQPGAVVRPVEWRAKRVANALPAAGVR